MDIDDAQAAQQPQGKRRHSRKWWNCYHEGCNRQFAKGKVLRKHIRESHKPIHHYTCPVPGCAFWTWYEDQIPRHLRGISHNVPLPAGVRPKELRKNPKTITVLQTWWDDQLAEGLDLSFFGEAQSSHNDIEAGGDGMVDAGSQRKTVNLSDEQRKSLLELIKTLAVHPSTVDLKDLLSIFDSRYPGYNAFKIFSQDKTLPEDLSVDRVARAVSKVIQTWLMMAPFVEQGLLKFLMDRITEARRKKAGLLYEESVDGEDEAPEEEDEDEMDTSEEEEDEESDDGGSTGRSDAVDN